MQKGDQDVADADETGHQFKTMSGFLTEVTEMQKEDAEDRKVLVLSAPHPPALGTRQERPAHHFYSPAQWPGI